MASSPIPSKCPCSPLKLRKHNFYCLHLYRHCGLPTSKQNGTLNTASQFSTVSLVHSSKVLSHFSCKPILKNYKPNGQIYDSDDPTLSINFLNYFSHAMTKQFMEEGYFGLGFRNFNCIMVGFMIVGMFVWDSSYLSCRQETEQD